MIGRGEVDGKTDEVVYFGEKTHELWSVWLTVHAHSISNKCDPS